MLTIFSSQMKHISNLMDSLINKTGDFGVPKIIICVRRNHFIVWAAACSRGIAGRFLIRETITSERYVAILLQFIATQQALEDSPNTEWFMQDCARPHRTEQVFSFLHEYFGERVIALGYPKYTGAGMDWPPYSADLTPCDYFLLCALKDIVYRNNPTTLDELEQSICPATPFKHFRI